MRGSRVFGFLAGFLTTLAAYGGWYYIGVSGGAPAGDCVWVEDLATPTTTLPLFDDDNYYSFRLNPIYYANLCEVTVSLSASGSPSGTIEASLRATAGGSGLPGTVVETSAVTLNASTLTGSATDYTFTFTDVPVQPWDLGTEWVLVLYKSTTDASNYVLLDVATTGGWNRDSDDGSTWSSPAQNDADMSLYANDAYPILLFQEDFETPGYENVWVESDASNVIDDANTGQVDVGSYAAYWNGTGVIAGSTYHDHVTDLTDAYGAFRFYLPSTASNFENFYVTGEDATTFRSQIALQVRMRKTSATTVELQATVYTGTPVTLNTTVDAWHLVEWHYTESTGTLAWKLDGVAQTTATGPTGRDWRYTHVGTDFGCEMYIDLLQVTDIDWIGDVGAASGAGGAAPSYDFVETFEGSEVDSQTVSGYDNTGWTSDSSGNDPNYTTNNLSGTYSLWLQNSPNRDIVRSIGPYSSDVWVCGQAMFLTSVPSQIPILNLRDSSGASDLIRFQVRTGTEETSVYHGTVLAETSSTSTIPMNTKLYYWLHARKSSGANDGFVEVFWSTTTTKGSAELTISNGDATDDIAQLELTGAEGAVHDHVLVFTSDPGDNPWGE